MAVVKIDATGLRIPCHCEERSDVAISCMDERNKVNIINIVHPIFSMLSR